ncbi:MAG: crossover junction endodeoxyribonuclease RuvC [Rickettsiales bacterium]|jgi:crossover junction endodeoxyribonuclease RuvC|nr:crossover junction endodeoxyribonuclease RuvC [Rickettsiales bacterium]
MIVIGVDPGLVRTGYGVVKFEKGNLHYIASGTIVTDSRMPIGDRLKSIFSILNDVLATYRPDYFSIEETFVNKNPVSSLKLGQARGVAIVCAGLNNIEVFEYKPNTIKKTISGVGKAKKFQIITMVKYILPQAPVETEDEADALAIAICHINNSKI